MTIALKTEIAFMKKMLLSATAVGAAIAGLVFYFQRKNKHRNSIAGAAKDAYQIMNEGMGRVERPAQHAMG